ncbi:uncharacterized protein LOC127719748 [Mytilus californianus]|uniref:uncharacterized protein LOC127719748 n=1 Tax=Mytilus californianus TaxID=6549 RepID=UPI0022460F60|nr:uncharacterized protein LOC127719748 [Mytilus californianus]
MISVKFLYLLCAVIHVDGHGRLWEPPSRSSMFRKGFPTPQNNLDNQLYCGGFSHQWSTNGGKCGICGDPYDQTQPRENEAGGKYATGIISAQYTVGQVIDISVEITANHKGWFEFRLCPNNDVKKPATHACLDKYLLKLADGSGTRDHIDTSVGMRTKKWILPSGLTCTQCVLQWKYHVGNNWGVSPDGTGCVGCGAQEEFYGCSDIAIEDPNGAGIQTTLPGSTISTSTTTTSKLTTTTTSPTATTTMNSNPYLGKTCVPTLVYKYSPGMTWWCTVNCRGGYCPATHCVCT